VAVFGIGGVEPLCSAAKELVNYSTHISNQYEKSVTCSKITVLLQILVAS
jgi:hypothetical protein